MSKLKTTLLTTAALAAIAGIALGQSLVQTNLSGNECWNAGQGPGGPTAGFICSNMLQSSQSVATNTGASSFTIGNNVATTIITAQPAAGTITLPPSPVVNGAIVEVVNGTTSAFATNVVNIAPNTGQTINGGNIAITTLAAKASVELRYVLGTNTWYQIR